MNLPKEEKPKTAKSETENGISHNLKSWFRTFASWKYLVWCSRNTTMQTSAMRSESDPDWLWKAWTNGQRAWSAREGTGIRAWPGGKFLCQGSSKCPNYGKNELRSNRFQVIWLLVEARSVKPLSGAPWTMNMAPIAAALRLAARKIMQENGRLLACSLLKLMEGLKFLSVFPCL